jgi:S1-C subfamily serine protease
MSRKISQFLAALIAAAMFTILGVFIGMEAVDNTADATANGDVFTAEAAFQRASFDVAAPSIEQISENNQQPIELSQTDMGRADLYDQVVPSVVSITVVRPGSGFGDLGGSGSGFVIDTSGHIATNYHVVEDATEIVVRFYDGTITRAEVVGLDPDSDIAVIEVDLPAEVLRPVTFGDVASLRVGQSVVAIGSPFGQDWTLTSGIISAKNRTIQGLGGYSIGSAIQTDTPINPGNSGGPLLNMQGEVIGVNSQILSQERSNSGVGFAVPSDLVVRVADELILNGEVAYSFIGIRGGDVGLAAMETLELPNNQRGILVCEIVANGPAAESDLQADNNGCGNFGPLVNPDIIVGINGQVVDNFAQLISYLARDTRPGDTITFDVLRDGEKIQISVTLGDRRDY